MIEAIDNHGVVARRTLMNSIAAYAVAIAWTGSRFEPSDAEPSAAKHPGSAPTTGSRLARLRGRIAGPTRTDTPLAGGDFARSELRFIRASRRWDALIRRLVEPTA
jgi:hypothetical protein